jgi:CubicO group peptidase (beta-lactamase class C family)
MTRQILTALLISFSIQQGFSQDFDKAKLDSYFKAIETNDKFMGNVAVIKDDKIIYSKSVGYIDRENKVKANEESKYRIGSISKAFTTVLILKAVEAEKLDLNQTIGKWFPTIKYSDKITVKNLLNHRSGIHNFTDDQEYLTWNTQPKTEKEMIEIITKVGSDFEPNTKSSYSNSNFVLLTYILEKSFKSSYSTILAKYITQPIGLINTYFGGQINTSKNESKSYRYMNTWKQEPETDMSVPLGAGGIVSTANDLVKFSNALFTGKLLKNENLEFRKSTIDRYGNGLFQIPFYNKIGYGHTGGIDGFSSVFSNFDNNVSYALVSNGTGFNNNDISIAVLSAVYNKPYDMPDFKSFNLTSEDLDKYLGIYSSTQFPLKITITKDSATLIAQATGQSSFPLKATDKDIFKFDQAGLVLEFIPLDKTMILKQGGGQYTLKKE